MTKVEKKKAVLSDFFGKKVVSVRKDKKGRFITVTFEDGSTQKFDTETPEFKFWTEQITEEELKAGSPTEEVSEPVTESSTEDEDFELEVEEVSSGKVKGQGK